MNNKSETQYLLRKIVQSKYLDLFAAALIFGVCYYRNFHQTMFFDSAIQFGIPISEQFDYLKNGAYPLGILSMIGAIFSMLATRLVGKQNNVGNGIGIITTVNSGTNDFLFGNASAIITYPFSFFLHSLATFKWYKGEKIRKRDIYYYLIILFGIVLAYILVYLGAFLFGGNQSPVFLNVVAITFGLSLGANFCNALKYEETWLSWIIYNIVQLVKNSIQMNIANVVKYIFYMFNAVVTFFDWKLNGDV